MKRNLVAFILFVLLGSMGWLILCGNRTNYGFHVIISEKLISHRGGVNYPENTMLAVTDAVERKYRIVEVDIKMTKDDIPVLCHDDGIENLSDGKGNIRELTLTELKRWDFGNSFYGSNRGVSILTLEEFLDYMYEKKCVAELDLVNDMMTPEMLDIVYGVVKESNMRHNTIFTVNQEQAIYLAGIDSSLIFCISGIKTIDDINNIPASKLGKMKIVSVSNNDFNGEICRYAHKKDFLVKTWTVNDADRIMQLIDEDCDLIITDTVTKNEIIAK